MYIPIDLMVTVSKSCSLNSCSRHYHVFFLDIHYCKLDHSADACSLRYAMTQIIYYIFLLFFLIFIDG